MATFSSSSALSMPCHHRIASIYRWECKSDTRKSSRTSCSLAPELLGLIRSDLAYTSKVLWSSNDGRHDGACFSPLSDGCDTDKIQTHPKTSVYCAPSDLFLSRQIYLSRAWSAGLVHLRCLGPIFCSIFLLVNCLSQLNKTFLRPDLFVGVLFNLVLKNLATRTVRAGASIIRAATTSTIWGSDTQFCTACSTAVWKAGLWKAWFMALFSTVQILDITFVLVPDSVARLTSAKMPTTASCMIAKKWWFVRIHYFTTWPMKYSTWIEFSWRGILPTRTDLL